MLDLWAPKYCQSWPTFQFLYTMVSCTRVWPCFRILDMSRVMELPCSITTMRLFSTLPVRRVWKRNDIWNYMTMSTSICSNVTIVNSCEVRIETSVTRAIVGHHETCWVMRTVIPSDGTFSSHQTAILDSLSCIIFLRHCIEAQACAILIVSILC